MNQTSTTITTTIDNVQEWYRATYPTEFQIDEINSSLTFSWLGENFCDLRGCTKMMSGLDTMVRGNIYHEALVRKLIALKAEGKSKRQIAHFIWEMTDKANFTAYGVLRALEDANMSDILEHK